MPATAVASSALPTALAFLLKVSKAAARVVLAMFMPPVTWLNVLAPPRAAASTAFCKRVLFSSMCPPSRAKAAIMAIAANAITIKNTHRPSLAPDIGIHHRALITTFEDRHRHDL
nr:hypothetical protein GCM10020185_57700 [Pseudomonas brassicacearum subsp. brassicacearum]